MKGTREYLVLGSVSVISNAIVSLGTISYKIANYAKKIQINRGLCSIIEGSVPWWNDSSPLVPYMNFNSEREPVIRPIRRLSSITNRPLRKVCQMLKSWITCVKPS